MSISTKFNSKNPDAPCNSNGGRVTNSPPAKISLDVHDGLKILSSNIDALKLSVNVSWRHLLFFEVLTENKIFAQSCKTEFPISFPIDDCPDPYFFNIKEFGTQGYEWILSNNEYSLLVGNWKKPQSRPSVLITIRSETLWRKGPRRSIMFILNFLDMVGGDLNPPKVSRLDLCVDTLFPESIWNPELLNFKVTRASGTETYQTHNQLTGFSIGKGKIQARLYDKPMEIKQVSNKTWLYDVWGFPQVPEGFKVIRIEYQLRREMIKELGLDSIDHIFDLIQSIWGYCTEKWLKFQDNPGKQSHQRQTFEWWKRIQNGLNDRNAGAPLIRCKALSAEKLALSQQIIGLFSSFAALESETNKMFPLENVNLRETFELFLSNLIKSNLNTVDFRQRVESKIARYHRTDLKLLEALELRKDFGMLPSSN